MPCDTIHLGLLPQLPKGGWKIKIQLSEYTGLLVRVKTSWRLLISAIELAIPSFQVIWSPTFRGISQHSFRSIQVWFGTLFVPYRGNFHVVSGLQHLPFEFWWRSFKKAYQGFLFWCAFNPCFQPGYWSESSVNTNNASLSSSQKKGSACDLSVDW